ncbi:MAG: hypothetical protein BJ554DRAFT_6554 [Olpidium bornovanus]|uniref:Uncharacterized protein n=1 Tax=Olpidium bornovanus TaxID=278681 RepID=A0A8H7ZXD2_9FUNG|nr:MAG: hypothetical protein BJ554DRAFT_6554 [Olpidium bornovanus]
MTSALKRIEFVLFSSYLTLNIQHRRKPAHRSSRRALELGDQRHQGSVFGKNPREAGGGKRRQGGHYRRGQGRHFRTREDPFRRASGRVPQRNRPWQRRKRRRRAVQGGRGQVRHGREGHHQPPHQVSRGAPPRRLRDVPEEIPGGRKRR